ncbi:MAG TPA: Ig-like domain-containing protein, partial [Longimicrobium sp.]|nr:Ig-like domain-containing protein [Longimicrobium sp.]
VSPPVDSVNVGETTQFTATCTNLHGNTVPCPATTWTSSNPAVATVSSTGLATGVAPGTVTITASIGYASGTAQLTVVQPNTPPVGVDDSFDAIGNVTVPVAAPGVLANDTDADGNTLTAVPGTFATTGGGTVTIAADGSFSYLSAPGFTGNDTFQYTVTDGIDNATATVTMETPTRVWYVSNLASGDGRDASPFATLAEAEAASAPGETIFLLFGNGTSGGYDAGITLKAGQALTGQGVSSDVTTSLNGQTVVLLASGSAPTITRASGTTIQLATNNTVQGVNVTSSAGAGIAGNGFGTFTASEVSVAAVGGPAVDLQNGTAAASFDVLSSSNSASSGVRLASVGGSFAAPSGSISGAAGAGVAVSGGNGTVSYGGSVSGSGTRAASITGRTGGSVTLSGDISDSAGGLLVQNNTGGTIAFTGGSKVFSTGASDGVTLASNAGATIQFGGGGLQIITTTGTGFNATGGGTLTVTGLGNAVGTTSGTAVRIVNTTLGAGGATFQSVSASNGANGIVLDNTGTGGFQVTGSGSAGSGGTIQGMTGAGISLASTANVSFGRMVIQSTGESGVKGTGVVNFAFTNGTIVDSGTGLGVGESNLAFNRSVTGTESNVSGTLVITGNTLTNAYYHGVDVVNFSGTLTSVDISGNTVTSATSTSSSRGSGIRLVARGSAATAASVADATIANNVIRNFPSAAGIEALGGNAVAGGPAGTFGTAGSGSSVIAISGNSIAGQGPGTRMGTNAIVTEVRGSGQGNFAVTNNGTAGSPIAFVAGTAIQHSVFGNAVVTTSITGNHLAPGNSFGAQGIGIGADQAFAVTDAPNLTVTVTGNTISQVDGNGILAVARNSAAVLRAKIQNNTVAAPITGARPGIRVDSGSALGNANLCLNISGNTSAGNGLLGIGLRKQGTNPAVNVYAIDGMAATATPGVEAYVDGLNPAGGGTQLLSASSGFSGCSFP